MSSELPVVECFHSIQGEGAHIGRSAFFIRLASCQVGCKWCDTKHSWPIDAHPKKNVIDLSALTANAYINGAEFVVITGGEPLHHNLDNLCKAIRSQTSINNNKAIPIHLETSGVDSISGMHNWITLSPKRHAPPRTELLQACNELKIIVHEKDDLSFAEEMASSLRNLQGATDTRSQKTLLFLQPGWNNELGTTLAFNHVRNNPKWRLSVQSHKWLGVN